MRELKTFHGYVTKCGVPVRFCVNGTFAWESDGDKEHDKPLRCCAASAITLENK